MGGAPLRGQMGGDMRGSGGKAAASGRELSHDADGCTYQGGSRWREGWPRGLGHDMQVDGGTCVGEWEECCKHAQETLM
jgi:hypothetical protein